MRDNTHSVRLTFEGADAIDIACRPDEDVATAALRHGHLLLIDCRDGVCAMCKGYLTDGDYDTLLPHTPDALSPSEEEEGYILACRLQPRSDLVIDFDYPAHRVERVEENVHFGQIVGLDRLSATIARLVVHSFVQAPRPSLLGAGLPADDPFAEAASADRVSFVPGQYMRLTLPKLGITREYSMANTPNDDRDLEFLVRVLPDGAFSSYIAERASLGERVTVEGPFGAFTLRPSDRVAVFVAGGSGVAPIVAMLRQLAMDDPEREALLFFGNTQQADLFFVDEIEELSRKLPNLRSYVSIVHPGQDWDGEVGLVTDALARHLTAPEGCDFYLCGPPALIEAARSVLKAKGVDRQHIHQESFTPSA